MIKFFEKHDKKIIKYSLILIVVFFIFSFLAPFLLVIPAKANFFDFSATGAVGDTIGGLMNPFIAISAALLTFLAFYIQKQANDNLNNDNKFALLHKNYVDRLNLIISEIDNFNISFHNNTLISNLNEVKNNSSSKKYNFTGLQGICLFITEYDSLRREIHKKYENEENKVEKIKECFDKGTYQFLMLQINNLIVFFGNTITDINKHKFSNDNDDIAKQELIDIAKYICYSKFDYIFNLYEKNMLYNEDLKLRIDNIIKFYKS